MTSVAGSKGSSSLRRLGQAIFSGCVRSASRSPTISGQDCTSATESPALRRRTGSSISDARSLTGTGLCPPLFPVMSLSSFEPSAYRKLAPMTPTITARKTHEEDRGATAAALLSWYDRHHRRLPWRLPPREVRNGASPDPYRVWLSEIMLQQTTVSAVKPYFERFMARWPTVEALANADTDDVMKAWAGLGYYSRARNLKKCAETVMDRHGGAFPDTEEELKRLPGIGDYTAAAIAAISFGRPAAVVDGNGERVIARLHAIETPLPAAKAEIRHIVQRLVPEDRPGDFAQAMMDLGATICTPRSPSCILCPVRDSCAARALSARERFPVKAPKA